MTTPHTLDATLPETLATDGPPGVVVAHLPAATGRYIGSPSIAILPGGAYVVSHDEFGPGSSQNTQAISHVYRSDDRGATWRKIATLTGAFWSTLFVHEGALYLLGTDREYGNVVIRRSDDGGATWTHPTDSATGLLRANGEYHCAPMPVLLHSGRLWRGMERRDPPIGWGRHFQAGMLSAPADADLLDADSWTLSTLLPSSPDWNGGDMGAWLEGNAVVTPGGTLVDILRIQTDSPDEKAAVVSVSADGTKAMFDPATGFIAFPGGAKKFTLRWDAQSRLYWSLSSIVLDAHRAPLPNKIRNTLALTSSPDLHTWTVRRILLHDADTHTHGFQYVDWLFDGDDILAACRTAFDDAHGGAHNYHDANFLTFHRIATFRPCTR